MCIEVTLTSRNHAALTNMPTRAAFMKSTVSLPSRLDQNFVLFRMYLKNSVRMRGKPIPLRFGLARSRVLSTIVKMRTKLQLMNITSVLAKAGQVMKCQARVATTTRNPVTDRTKLTRHVLKRPPVSSSRNSRREEAAGSPSSSLNRSENKAMETAITVVSEQQSVPAQKRT